MKRYYILSFCILIGYAIIATCALFILGASVWLPIGCLLYLGMHHMSYRIFSRHIKMGGREDSFITWLVLKEYPKEVATQVIMIAAWSFLARYGSFFCLPAAFSFCWLTTIVCEYFVLARKEKREARKGERVTFPE